MKMLIFELKLCYKNFIINQFYKIVTKNLVVTVMEVNVKKGTRKYDLVIITTPKGELIYNLGRHE